MSGLVIGALVATPCLVALGAMFWLAAKAPLGWEDEDGWHEGIEPLADPDNWGAQ